MRETRILTAASVIAGAVVACCAITRGDTSAADRDLRWRQIAEKSESERLRLQRNFREFRGLSVEEQKRLHSLNDQLKKDDRDQGGLRGVMTQYHEWLATLTPGQRLDLEKLTDPNVREKRVREFLKEQQEHAESTGPASSPRSRRGLSSDDLAAVLAVMEQALVRQQMLTDEEKTQLQPKVGLARHMFVMEAAYRRPGIPPMQQFGFMPKVVDAMTPKISNDRQRNNVVSRGPFEKSWAMFMLIKGGLINEYESKKPDDATLELFFVQLPSHKQDEVMRLPHDRQQQKLTQLYLEKKSETNPNEYPRPPRPGFWAMQPPPGLLRPPGSRGGDPQRGAEGDQTLKDNPRRKDKKDNKNGAKRKKAAGEPDNESGAPEG
jgi:hypothetical protein